jgi:hypothetical protein
MRKLLVRLIRERQTAAAAARVAACFCAYLISLAAEAATD